MGAYLRKYMNLRHAIHLHNETQTLTPANKTPGDKPLTNVDRDNGLKEQVSGCMCTNGFHSTQPQGKTNPDPNPNPNQANLQYIFCIFFNLKKNKIATDFCVVSSCRLVDKEVLSN